MQAELLRLKEQNAILQENLQLRQMVDDLRAKVDELGRPATLVAEEITEIMRFGINKGYDFINDLEKLKCPVIRYGREARVPTEGFFRWLNSGGGKHLYLLFGNQDKSTTRAG